MGTLYNQKPRRQIKVSDSDITELIESAKEHANKHQVDIQLVLEAYRIKELERRNDLMIHNGDIFDEQMAGIGELINVISSTLENMANHIVKEDP